MSRRELQSHLAERGRIIRCHPIAVGILSTIVLVTMPAGATVTVTFVNPQFFTDIGDLAQDPRQTLLVIERYLKGLGDRYLSPQDTLRIEVLDISLAGRPRLSWNGNSVVRVMTGEADWPRIELRYTLESDGTTSTPAEETVVDTVYLRRLEWRYSSATLPYEERMLDEWFKARFVEPTRDNAKIRAAANNDRRDGTITHTGMLP